MIEKLVWVIVLFSIAVIGSCAFGYLLSVMTTSIKEKADGNTITGCLLGILIIFVISSSCYIIGLVNILQLIN